ncbi:hypothetical protein ASPVEDRAFT_38757 [Aspergillus versicolor CBS 583.65]|uniref:Uncharacterized protein n=1 Tax=Aspergillus versicolor CBS 583.65 TaxID=1036611 RepID=A0A1L9PCZ9_ASPVE|nr:uncharacterized protein ASPVEDRAFT_38757 [Aspergillus versicolor CBS 583.65]OJI99334.1 hypothetical protein ASPVEDRAFT_38757 [Aspergillus versicolor CBS 583.65]
MFPFPTHTSFIVRSPELILSLDLQPSTSNPARLAAPTPPNRSPELRPAGSASRIPPRDDPRLLHSFV